MTEPTDAEVIEQTIDDLTPPRLPLRSLLREFTHGTLRNMTWAEFEAKFGRNSDG